PNSKSWQDCINYPRKVACRVHRRSRARSGIVVPISARTPQAATEPQPSEGNNAMAQHPKGLYLLFVTEMWERFSYYGMRAIFTLYMVNALLFDKAKASAIYGSYTGLVYLTPLLGGYIADRYWGNRSSIIFGGMLMAIGQF